MAVIAVFQDPSLTQEQYERSVSDLTGGKSRMQSPADWPVEGLLAHIAGQGKMASASSMCGSPRRRSAASARS
jgi:hypothetical protein